MSIGVNTTLDVTTANTYQKIIGTWSDGSANNWSVSDANDRLTYNGTQTLAFLFTGVMDFSASKANNCVIGLYKNGSLLAGAETYHEFTSVDKIGTIAITRILNVTPGSYFEVWIKSDDDTVVFTFSTINITFFGEN